MATEIRFDFKRGTITFEHNAQPHILEVEVFVTTPAVHRSDRVMAGHWQVTIDGKEWWSLSWPGDEALPCGYVDAYVDSAWSYAKPGAEVRIDAWMTKESGGESVEIARDSAVIMVAIPPSPYPSWVWDDGQWRAPVPIPTHPPADPSTPYWDWDEQNQEWVAQELLL